MAAVVVLIVVLCENDKVIIAYLELGTPTGLLLFKFKMLSYRDVPYLATDRTTAFIVIVVSFTNSDLKW